MAVLAGGQKPYLFSFIIWITFAEGNYYSRSTVCLSHYQNAKCRFSQYVNLNSFPNMKTLASSNGPSTLKIISLLRKSWAKTFQNCFCSCPCALSPSYLFTFLPLRPPALVPCCPCPCCSCAFPPLHLPAVLQVYPPILLPFCPFTWGDSDKVSTRFLDSH